MTASVDVLEAGDVIEIKYCLWRATSDCGEDVVVRWIRAYVMACERGAWPLAHLADGQATEIRPFMTWRWVSRVDRRVPVAA